MNSIDDFDELDHPDWFYREIVEDYLPWEQGRKTNFTEFNKKYTLHDSGWIGIFFNVAYEQTATLAIRWDAVWLPDEIAESTSIVSNWPYLFIQLKNIEQFSTSNYDDIGSLDTTGKILCGIILAPLLLVVLIVILSALR